MLDSKYSRRGIIKTGAIAAGALCMPAILTKVARAQAGTRTINLQLGWLASGNQLGEVVAQHLGFFEEEGLQLSIQPGGPSNDGIAIVASGRCEIGQVSSSPSLMLAASQGLPVRSFAANVQKHPYAYYSLPDNPIRTPQDMVGKKIGIHATGRVLLNAMLKTHGISESDVEVVVIGSDMTPLLTGQTHAVAGWLSNVTALSVLGPDRIDMMLWDQGVRLYASTYYATTETLEREPELLAAYLRAAGKGWAYAHGNRDAAIDLLIRQYPDFVRDDERAALEVMMRHIFTEATAANGWATIDPAIWQHQISLYESLGQFSAGAPKLENVITTDILDLTAIGRPKIG